MRLGELQLPARYRADTGAYGSYLRGLSLRFQGRHREALDTFAALVARAPQYPPGLAGLAHSYGFAVLAGLKVLYVAVTETVKRRVLLAG